jgi:NAD(P)-dependent dehydrogenase (short-subunit alcohol dehydrogenase family)
VANAVRAVIERAGRIDILVNNAGFGYIGLNETATLEDVQRQFDTNVFGVVRMNRAVLPHMRLQGRGLLVYVSSSGGHIVVPFLGLYCASKFALEALAESYHYQLYGLGIDSVIIQPGRYATAVAAKGVHSSDPPAQQDMARSPRSWSGRARPSWRPFQLRTALILKRWSMRWRRSLPCRPAHGRCGGPSVFCAGLWSRSTKRWSSRKRPSWRRLALPDS